MAVRSAGRYAQAFDGLAALVRNRLDDDPLSGHLFVFINRRRTLMKVLYFDRGGYCLWCKRLEQGRFQFDAGKGDKQALSWTELKLLLEGIELGNARRYKRFERIFPGIKRLNGKMQRIHSSASNASHGRDFVAGLLASKQALENEVEDLRAHVAKLRQQVEFFKRQLFGAKSEKRLVVDPAQTGLLFGELPRSEVPEPTEQISYTRRKTKDRTGAVTDSGLRFGDDVPVETIEVDDPEIEAIPPEHREVIGEEVSFRIAQRPASYVMLKYVRPVVKDTRDQKLHTGHAPEAVLENSVADVSFLAGMLVDKFCFHLPLYRQHQRLVQAGITLARATLTNLSQRAIEMLKPIHDAQLKHILQSRVLAMDETPIRAGPNKKTKGKMHQGWYWPVYGQDDEISFIYSPSRGADVVKNALGEHFEGVLVTDGYAAYGRYAASRPEVTAANCWAHTRRQFERARDAEPNAAAQALEIIGRLYSIEREIQDRQLTGEDKLAARSKKSASVVDAFLQWCERQRKRMDLIPSNPLARALKYAFERVDELQVFLGDPDVPVDTNHLERALQRTLIQRAGRLLKLHGKVVLSMNGNPAVEEGLLDYLSAFEEAA